MVGFQDLKGRGKVSGGCAGRNHCCDAPADESSHHEVNDNFCCGYFPISGNGPYSGMAIQDASSLMVPLEGL